MREAKRYPEQEQTWGKCVSLSEGMNTMLRQEQNAIAVLIKVDLT
jgi:hypothetical protein